MDGLQILANLLSLMAFALIGAAVMKAFQMHQELTEIKDLLRDIRRNTEDNTPAGLLRAAEQKKETLKELDEQSYAALIQQQVSSTQSQEALARAVNSPPVLQPEVMPPGPPPR